MLKIRALNEPQCSSESEDEDNPRLSKEAQESNAIALYNEALRFQQRKEPHEAVEILQKILDLPYLNELENKSLSPLQTQTRLGCLKCLSSLYTNGPTKNLKRGLEIFELLTELEPSNVNNWYRYGKVALELKDFSLAFDAFQKAHSCSNGHWGCIEKMVTLSYVVHDMTSCLKYCAVGLAKDPSFVKGLVFRDYVFEMNPWIKSVIESKRQGFESLFVRDNIIVDDSVRKKYLDEARIMIRSYAERQRNLRQQEEIERNTVLICPYHLKSVNFLELCRTVIAFEKYIKELGNLSCQADISGVLSRVSQSGESINGITIDNCDELSESSGLRRSRSSSDDKDPGTSCCDAGNGVPSGVIDNDEKSDDDSQTAKDQNMAQSEGADEESSQKKKARRDVKWWQLEGKRRSQRVRGNLMPTSPNKPKSENSFAEMLRNVIPPLLLVNDDSNPSREKENPRLPQKRPIVDSSKHVYFGSTHEADDVKRFINECGTTDITTIISKLIRLLCREFKGNWPIGLDELFLDLFNTYRSTTHVLNDMTEESDTAAGKLKSADRADTCKFGDEAYIALTAAEVLMDTSKVNDAVSSVMYELSNNISVDSTEFVLRKMWMQVKQCFRLCKAELMEYSFVQRLLVGMLEILNQQPNYVCYVPSQTDCKISAESIQDKIIVAEKMENLNKINELYEAKNFEALVDILQFSLTSGDGDLRNRLYLAESHYHLRQIQCVEQCAKVCQHGIRTLSDELLLDCVILLTNIWRDMKESLNLKEFKLITNALLQLLIYYEKRSIDQDFLMTEPWCLLHSVIHHLEETEKAFYIEEDSVPNSVLVLQLGHEVLSRNGKCCVDDGRLLLHTMCILLKLQGVEDYWAHEETKTCLDQAILCLFSHPNKTNKLKNVKDHAAVGIKLTWKVCCQLYQYYKEEKLPEFDSYGSISVEVENLFQRIIQEMPEGLVPKDNYKEMTEYVEGKRESKPDILWNIPTDISDMYYLIADFHLKNKDFQKAVEFYIWDLAVRPYRFDSWAAIALSKAEDIYSKLNSCDRFCIEDLTSKAQAVVRCFQTALDLDETNSKVRIEFGSFLYALHSIYSRELKFHTHQFSLDLFDVIEKKKNEYLLEAEKWFEPHLKSMNGTEEENLEEGQNEEVWINHYMLGKVTEKLHPNDPEVFLKQYELAGKLLHAQGAPYPARINYYNAPEFALEALEIYYRTHASILSYVERMDYSESTETLLMSFIQHAENSPFVKSKLSRGGESSESKKKKGMDESVSKKDLSEISDLLYEMVGSVEEMLCNNDSQSSNDSFDSQTATTEEDSGDETSYMRHSSKDTSAMSSFSLSAFKDKMKEKELRQVKLAEEASKFGTENAVNVTRGKKPEAQLDSLLDNLFHHDFSGVKYGKIVSYCLKAMKECIARYPQSFKAYYRIAYCYKVFKKDLKKAREYFMGNSGTGANKILGLYGERKPNNFFNGIWRNPSDDIDRPGSFPFHMAKSIQLLLSISQELYDHQLLAEMGIQLAKIPDSHNAYLFTEDREQFSKEAIRTCLITAKKAVLIERTSLLDCGTRIYDTYTKFQKHTPRENAIGPVLLDVYKQHAQNKFPMINTSAIFIHDAVKYFQHLAWTSKANCAPQKPQPTSQKQGENSRKNTSEDKTVATGSSANYDAKRPTLRKSTSHRRMSDQEPLPNTDQAKPRSIASHAPVPVPSVLPNVELGNLPRKENLTNLMAYATQLNNYFASLPPMIDDSRNSKQLLSHSQLKNSARTQSTLNKPIVTTVKRDKPQSSNVPNLISFNNPQESLPSVNQLISNVSRAIALSFGSNQSSDDKKSTVQPRAKEKLQLPTVENQCCPSDYFINVVPAKHKPAIQLIKNSVERRDENYGNLQEKKRSQGQSSLSLQSDAQHKQRSQGNVVPLGIVPLTHNIHGGSLRPTSVVSTSDSYRKFPSSSRGSRVGNTCLGPKVVSPTKLPIPVIRRPITFSKTVQNTKPYQGIGSRPVINTSPFQAQTTAMHKPSIEEFFQGSARARAENLLATRIPPAAHYQASFNSRPSSFENEPEVVDLTTKSPEKPQSQDNAAIEARVIPKQRPVKRPISTVSIEKERHYPLPPKKKHHIMPLSPIQAEPQGADVEVITIE